jgi:phosphoribosylaminoimidazole-succinocarboxamide synthase
MSDEFVASVSERYIELFEHITGEEFVKQEVDDVLARVENNILNYLQ